MDIVEKVYQKIEHWEKKQLAGGILLYYSSENFDAFGLDAFIIGTLLDLDIHIIKDEKTGFVKEAIAGFHYARLREALEIIGVQNGLRASMIDNDFFHFGKKKKKSYGEIIESVKDMTQTRIIPNKISLLVRFFSKT